MMFGLRKAPATFQCELDIILLRDRWNTCLFYRNDVAILFKGRFQHVKDINELLTLLLQDEVTLALPKCPFLSQK